MIPLRIDRPGVRCIGINGTIPLANCLTVELLRVNTINMGRRRNYDSAQAKREFSQALRDVEVGSLSRAEKRLRRLARAFPDNAPVQFNLALVLQQQGRNAAAVEAFRFAAKADPKNPDVWLALGQALVAKGEVAHAKDSLERVIGLQVGSTAAYMLSLIHI